MEKTVKNTIATRQIAILVANGVNESVVKNMIVKLTKEGAQVKIIAPLLGQITGVKGGIIVVDKTLFDTSSVLFDAVYVPGGSKSIGALSNNPDAIHFINQAYKHRKAIALDSDAVDILKRTAIANWGKPNLPNFNFPTLTFNMYQPGG